MHTSASIHRPDLPAVAWPDAYDDVFGAVASPGEFLEDTALDDLAEGCAVLDASMRVVAWNRAATLITGYPAEAALGGLCVLAGDALTLDPTAPPDPSPPAVPPPPRRWFFRFRVREIEGALPAVVAAVIPLRQGDLGFFVHFLPAVAEMLGGDGLDRGPDPAEPPAPAEAPLAGLTRREREILRLLAAGKTAKPIAAELGLSVPTVRTHIQHILRKLDVHSSLEAAVRFLRTAAP